MFCGKCGSEIEDNARFCGKCGATMGSDANASSQTIDQASAGAIPNVATVFAAPTAPVASAALATAQAVSPPSSPTASYEVQSHEPDGRRRMAIIISIVAIVVIAICGIYAFFQHKAYEETHAPATVSLGFSFASAEGAEASSDAMPIGIPMGIKGIDLDGNSVNERFLTTPSGEQRELFQGSYEISVLGDPITTGGIVYSCNGEDAVYAVSISIDSEGNVNSSLSNATFTFTALPVVDVTDEVIADIRSWTEEFDVSTAETDAAIKAATDKREAELARIAAEEERARQEAEAARLEQERQAALAANPTYAISDSQTVQLTGTVRTVYATSSVGNHSGNICYLELPHEIKLDGKQYGASNNKVVISDSFSQYVGKTITISTRCTANIKPSSVELTVSNISGNNTTLVRVW